MSKTHDEQNNSGWTPNYPKGHVPDLTPTVIDSETGEVIHQGLEGEELEYWKKKRAPEWEEFHNTMHERRGENLVITPEMLGLSSEKTQDASSNEKSE